MKILLNKNFDGPYRMDGAHYVCEVASRCKEAIENPCADFGGILEVIDIIKNKMFDNRQKGIGNISLLKVFKNIVPQYKIRSLKDVVKDSRDSLRMKNYDKVVLKLYVSYVELIVNDTSSESYVSACEILKHFDHFNCADKIVLKVLEGSIDRGSVSTLCCDTIRSKLLNDNIGNTTLLILNHMLDSKYSPLVTGYLVDVPFLEDSMKDDMENEEDCCLMSAHSTEGRKDSIFSRKKIMNKKLAKIERRRLTVQREVKTEEDIECRIEELRLYKKAHNAIQRVYFMILKGNMDQHYEHVFTGLKKYRRIIRPEFMEGLHFMLNNSLTTPSLRTKLKGVQCILLLYEDKGYDFKRLVDVIYSVAHPLNLEFEEIDYEDFVNAVRCLFIRIRQPSHRAYVLLSRLVLHRNFRFVPLLNSLIKELIAFYEIEPSDYHSEYQKQSLSKTDIDLVLSAPLFEYCIYRKII